MPLTLPFKDNLAEPLAAGSGLIRLQGSSVDLCAEMATPKHAFATIYTLSGSERVLVTGCNSEGVLTVTRGVDGTTARSWPVNACIKLSELLPGAVCPDEGMSDDGCALFDPVVSVPLGKGLRWDESEPGNPKLALAPTGVVPTNAACGEINECGQLVSIPENWPVSCLTPFDPCCGDDGAGGGADACDVGYTTGSTSGIITASNVCEALDQLADYVGGATGGGSGVEQVHPGGGVSVTGTLAHPTVGLTATGVTAGTYDGFTVNDYGQVVSYLAPSGSALVINGTDPIVSNFNVGTGEYTISVLTAGVGQLGVVELADASEAANPTPSVPDDAVVTYEFLLMWATTQGLI